MEGCPPGERERDDCICIGNSMICSDNFGINTTSDISKLLYVISRAVRLVNLRQF